MRLSAFPIIASILALTSVATAQPVAPAPPVPPPAAPAPAAPAPAAPAPAAPAPAAEAPPAAAPPAAAPAPAAPAPVAAAPVAAAPAAADPALDAKPAEPPAPQKMSVGKEGLWQPGGLFQIWLLNQNLDGDDTLSFRVRRAEFRFKGEIVPKLVAYQAMFDMAKILEFAEEDVEVVGQEPAPTAPGTVAVDQPRSNFYSPLQDVGITFLSDYADVTLGQYKIQVSYEGFNGSAKVVFPERSLVSRYYGDRRDVGVKAEKKLNDHFFYSLGLYNGAGQNRFTDNDNQKDVALRLEAYPIEGVTLGAVGYMGVGERDVSATKDRVEGDLKVELANALLQAEYIHGWDGPTDSTRVEGHGFYVTGGYTFLERIQPIVRVGYLDQDVDSDASGGDQTLQYEGGMNYFLRGNEARLALTLGFFDDKLEGEPTRTDVTFFTQMSF